MGRIASPADEGPYNLRSDGEPGIDGHLGSFRRGPAVFTLYELAPGRGRHPLGPVEYLIDVEDGVGPHECCRFVIGPGSAVEAMWNGAWNGDEWCEWIIERSLALIANPDL